MSGSPTDQKKPRNIYEEFVDDFPYLFTAHDVRDNRSDVPEGWRHLVWEMAQRMTDLVLSSEMTIRISQIKEKWGTLRCYARCVRPGDMPIEQHELAQLREITDTAAKASEDICLFCGRSPADLFRFGGWVATACEKHGAAGDRLPRFVEE
jgi:hypothetical protein